MSDAHAPVPSDDARLAAEIDRLKAAFPKTRELYREGLRAAVLPLRPDADREPPVPAREARQHGDARGRARRVLDRTPGKEPRAHRGICPFRAFSGGNGGRSRLQQS